MKRAMLFTTWMAALALSISGRGQTPVPDRVLLNGAVITMTREGDVAEAIAIREGKIAAVGTTNEIRALAGPKTEVVDLGGKAVLPGFYAAHDHFPSSGRVALYEVDLNIHQWDRCGTSTILWPLCGKKPLARRQESGSWVAATTIRW